MRSWPLFVLATTLIASPVTAAAPSLHSQHTALATSCGCTRRRCGLPATSNARDSASERPVVCTMRATLASVIPVSLNPGQTALTVMPFVATSCASDRVSPINACFDALYAVVYA